MATPSAEIDRAQYYSGGYFLIRSSQPDWDEPDKALLPETIISLSTCFCPRFDLTWTWDSHDTTQTKQAEATAFGIDLAQWDNLKAWCTDRWHAGEIEMYSLFHPIIVAQMFVAKFIKDTTNLHLIEVGLPIAIGQNGWREQMPDDGHVVGVEKHINKEMPLSNTGVVLGHEVISYAYHDFGHSWLCSHLHRDMNTLYGIIPNQYGLLDNYDDAKAVYDWIAGDKMAGTRAEPEPYDFWLVISHELKNDAV